MIAIVYVGKKPFAIDNVAGSGRFWNGHGDVQEVTNSQAKILLKFPDQWALQNPEADSEAVEKEATTTFIAPDGERVTVPESALAKPLEKMSADELRAYAIDRHALVFKSNVSKKSMMDAIQEKEAGLPPITAPSNN